MGHQLSQNIVLRIFSLINPNILPLLTMKKLKKIKAASRKDCYRNSGLWSVFKRDSSLTSSDKLAPLVLLRLQTLRVNRKVAYCCLLCTLRKLNCPSKESSKQPKKYIQGYTSLELHIVRTILAQVYLVYTLSILHVVYERIHTIVTALQIVHGYPMHMIRMSSLSCYSCYLNIVTAQINLEPLVYIVVIRFPSSYKIPIWF